MNTWVNGKGPNTQFPRTARMIAVCWILVNKFDCVIKGGFVRDWIINADEKVPLTSQLRRDLLQHQGRNPFKEVIDDSVTPSDIDVEMSSSKVFDPILFEK